MSAPRHAADASRALEHALLVWAGRHLTDISGSPMRAEIGWAGQDVDVATLTPFWSGPAARTADPGPGISLFGDKERRVGVTPGWSALGAALEQALPMFGESVPTAVPMDTLSPALRAWYTPRLDWHTDGMARPPTLWWRPGVAVKTYWLLFLGERTDIGPILTGMAAALHHDGIVRPAIPPLPTPAELISFAEVVGADAPEVAEALAAVRAPAETPVGLVPGYDLSTMEFAALHRALGRPLRPAAYFVTQLAVAATVEFGPAVSVRVAGRQLPRGGKK